MQIEGAIHDMRRRALEMIAVSAEVAIDYVKRYDPFISTRMLKGRRSCPRGL